MAVVSQGAQTVRLNDLDWRLLEVFADGKRYTPKYLYADVDELTDDSPEYVRQEIKHLHDTGLIDRVASSSMYTINEYGRAALEVRGDITDDMTPKEVGDIVRSAVSN